MRLPLLTWRSRAPLLALLGAVAGIAACQKVTLNAPPTSTIALSAAPASIAATGGVSTIRALVRLGNGQVVPDGIVVSFFTTLGTIDASAKTVDGVATVELVSNGVPGTATVSALSGAASVATTEVAVGSEVGRLSVNFSPLSLPTGGGTATVTVTLVDPAGLPLVGRPVTLTTTAGTLASRGSPRQTNAAGVATDTITTTVSSTVTASVSGSAITASGTLPVTSQAAASLALFAEPPSLPVGGGSVALRAFATTATGAVAVGETVTFSAPPGTLSATSAITDAQGIASVVLTIAATTTAQATSGTAQASATVTVGGTTASSRNIQLSASRSAITDRTLGGGPASASACGGGPNPQLPIVVFARVTDGVGSLIDGIDVTLTVEDLASDTNDGHGGFCSGGEATARCYDVAIPGCATAVAVCPTPTPTPVPLPTPPTPTPRSACCNGPTLSRSATARTGTAGAGTARFEFTFEDTDLCACSVVNRRCTARLVSSAPFATSVNDVTITFTP